MTGSNNIHTHSYKAIRGQKGMYMCTDPHCTFTTTAALIDGKAALCAECSAPFVISFEQLRRNRRKLKCPACSKRFAGTKPERVLPALDMNTLRKDLEKLG